MRIKKRYQKGFTLVELMVVLAILGIIVGVIGIRMNNTVPASKLDAVTTQIRDHIRFARSRARMTQDKYRVVFNKNNNTYKVYKRSNYLSTPMGDPVKEPSSGNFISYDLDTDEEFSGGDIREFENFGSGDLAVIEYDPRGKPYDQNGNLLSDPAKVKIEYDSYSSKVVVEPVTGEVTIE